MRLRRRAATGALAAALVATTMVACTSTARTSTTTQGPTSTARVIPTAPVAAGPTTTTRTSCPLVSQAVTQNVIGQRLDHTTVQTSGGKVIGCEFYPITVGLAVGERLPTGGHASARIVVATYPSALSARQVLAITARSGGEPALQKVDGLVAETFRTHFYPPDGADDWACLFLKGSLLVSVLVADQTTSGEQNAIDLAAQVAPKV